MRRKDDHRGLTRREFQRLGGAALAAACLPGTALRARAEEPLVTDIPANEPILQQLQYVHVSEKEGQQCEGCLLYAAKGEGVGKCQILPNGLVKETGWCLSWAPKA